MWESGGVGGGGWGSLVQTWMPRLSREEEEVGRTAMGEAGGGDPLGHT